MDGPGDATAPEPPGPADATPAAAGSDPPARGAPTDLSPVEDAVAGGAPLDTRPDVDPRLVAAERVIAELRALLGALVVTGGGRVTVRRRSVTNRRAATLRILRVGEWIELAVDDPEPTPPTMTLGEQVPDAAAGDDPGREALTRRLAQILAKHGGSSTWAPTDTEDTEDTAP